MSSRRALVVDDSKVGRLTMQKKLETFGVGVDLAESGLEALAYLERHRPDMIFMDHMMPDLDGFEATRRIKAVPATRDIPVIIISGSDDEAFVREARAIGALDAIAKPPANEAIERILVSLPQTHTATVAREVTPPAPAQQPGAAAFMDQVAAQAMIEARLAEAVERLHGSWLSESRMRWEAAFENERQLQRAWRSRLEQGLDQAMAGLADITRLAAQIESARQQLRTLETRLFTLETLDHGTAEPPTAWLESIDQRVARGLAELEQDTERQAARLDALRQELLQRVDVHGRQSEQAFDDLAGRLEGMSEAMQRHMAGMQTWVDSQRLGSSEQRLATLESAVSRAEVDLASLKTTLSGHFADTLRERDAALAVELDHLRNQLQTLGLAQDALRSGLTAQSARLDALMQERFAQLRAELEAALQSAASGPEIRPVTAPVEARAQPTATEPEMSEHAAGALPAVTTDQAPLAPMTPPIASNADARWQAEVEGLQRRLRTLTLATAAGGAALLAALVMLAL